MVEKLERLKMYVLNKPFRVFTDCVAITNAKTSKQLRWFMKIFEFDCEFIHRERSRIAHVDALRRSLDQPSRDMEPAGFAL